MQRRDRHFMKHRLVGFHLRWVQEVIHFSRMTGRFPRETVYFAEAPLSASVWMTSKNLHIHRHLAHPTGTWCVRSHKVLYLPQLLHLGKVGVGGREGKVPDSLDGSPPTVQNQGWGQPSTAGSLLAYAVSWLLLETPAFPSFLLHQLPWMIPQPFWLLVKAVVRVDGWVLPQNGYRCVGKLFSRSKAWST